MPGPFLPTAQLQPGYEAILMIPTYKSMHGHISLYLQAGASLSLLKLVATTLVYIIIVVSVHKF